jgi:hypothetical protein
MKIFVQQIDDKFINNLIISLRKMSYETISTGINNNLYKLDHIHKFNTYVFVSDLFSNEIAQFISEYHNKNDKQFFIYYPSNQQYEELVDFNKVCKTLSWNPIQSTDIRIPENILNKELFSSSDNIHKKNQASVFLDKCANDIPDQIMNYLYPNTLLPIKMFNNSRIIHHQNLGLLNEFDRSKVLIESAFFIDIDNYYTLEAASCGCDIVSIEKIAKNNKANTFTVNTKKTKELRAKAATAISYQDFIKKTIL